MPDAIDNNPQGWRRPGGHAAIGHRSRHGRIHPLRRVLEDDDSAMGVKTALALINRVWEEIENELDADFDPATQVALAWFATYGFDAKLRATDHARQCQEHPTRARCSAPACSKTCTARPGLIPRDRATSRLVAGHRQDRDGLGVRAAHRARADRAEDGGADGRGGAGGANGPQGRRMRARSPIGCSKSPRKRAGRPRRWSTTNSPRNGRIWKTSPQRAPARATAARRQAAVRAGS